MRLVIVESPFRGVPDAVAYARAALLDCLLREEAPLASHLLYTQVLDDSVAEQRDAGIQAGLAWGRVADATVVYTDLGISEGMKLGMERAADEGRHVELRQLPGEWRAACQWCEWVTRPEGHYTQVAAIQALDRHIVDDHPELQDGQAHHLERVP
jgi:hypothetical protein